MAAFNELSLSPDGATHDIAPADAHEVRPAVDAGDRPDDLILTTPRAPHRDRMERTLRTILKPLIALATARYVLVTALAAFTAFIVASEAGKAINAKLEPVVTALKRF